MDPRTRDTPCHLCIPMQVIQKEVLPGQASTMFSQIGSVAVYLKQIRAAITQSLSHYRTRPTMSVINVAFNCYAVIARLTIFQ